MVPKQSVPLIFGIFQHLVPSGMTPGSWRNPASKSIDYLSLTHWTDLAVKLEQGGFDFLFLADSYAYPTLNDKLIPRAVEDALQMPIGDPVVIVSAIAAATSRLGIVATTSTMIERPQALARRLATLDHLTAGRVGWNIVTGSGQAASAKLFGEAMTPHDVRYDMAEDYVQLVLKLWEGSWEDDAVVADKDAGVYARANGVHPIHHEGLYYKADGILTVPASPQRTPYLLQAGASGRGKRFAAKYAESVFLAGGAPIVVADTIRDIRELALEAGRGPDSIKFLVGASFIAGENPEAAQAKRDQMLSYTSTESAAASYAYFTGIDLLAMDQNLPLQTRTTELGQTNVDRFTVGDNPPTVAEILEDYRTNGVNGTTFIGDGEAIANQVEAFIAETGADGFLIQPYDTPGTYDDFVEFVFPELKRRGLARNLMPGSTLREQMTGKVGGRLPDEHPGALYRASLNGAPLRS